MKLDDLVYSTKVRPDETAKIIRCEMEMTDKKLANGIFKKIVKTKYTAEYDDGCCIIFYGFNIGKTIFKKEKYIQTNLFDELEVDEKNIKNYKSTNAAMLTAEEMYEKLDGVKCAMKDIERKRKNA